MEIQKAEEIIYQAVERKELMIDPLGRVWRVALRVPNRWTGLTTTIQCPIKRAEHRTKQGYLQVRVMTGKRRVHASAHRLVYRHFKGPIPDGLTINHKNGIKDDNRPENLELATASEQTVHAVRKLKTHRAANQNGMKHCCAKLTDDQVLQIRKDRQAGETQPQIAAKYGLTQGHISAICNGKYWRHLPSAG